MPSEAFAGGVIRRNESAQTLNKPYESLNRGSHTSLTSHVASVTRITEGTPSSSYTEARVAMNKHSSKPRLKESGRKKSSSQNGGSRTNNSTKHKSKESMTQLEAKVQEIINQRHG